MCSSDLIDKQIASKWRAKTREQVQKAFEYVDLGQQLEKHYNCFAQFEQAYRMDLPKLPAEVQAFIDRKSVV